MAETALSGFGARHQLFWTVWENQTGLVFRRNPRPRHDENGLVLRHNLRNMITDRPVSADEPTHFALVSVGQGSDNSVRS